GSTLNVGPDPGNAANQAYTLGLGPIPLNGVTTFNVANPASATGTLTVGALSDGPTGSPISSSLVKAGAGNMVLTGADTYTGTTTVNGGALVAGNAAAFPATTAVTVANGGTLSANGFNVTIGSLTGAGTVNDN